MEVMKTTKKVVILILKGDIDLEDVLALKGIINSFIEKENFFFILDLSKVTHINVSGIEYLLWLSSQKSLLSRFWEM